MQQEMFEALGGAPFFDALIDELRRRSTADPELAPSLSGLPSDRKWTQMRAFLAVTCGATEKYDGGRLRWSHARHRIRGDQFRRFLGHLSDSMLKLGAAPEHIARLLSLLAPLREEIASSPTLTMLPAMEDDVSAPDPPQIAEREAGAISRPDLVELRRIEEWAREGHES